MTRSQVLHINVNATTQFFLRAISYNMTTQSTVTKHMYEYLNEFIINCKTNRNAILFEYEFAATCIH